MVDQVPVETSNQDQTVTTAATPDSLGWRAGLPDPLKTDATFTPYKTVGDFAKAHIETAKKATELESKLASAIIKPGENATPEEMAAYHKALGVPEKADDYEFPVVEGTERDEKTEKFWKEAFHEIGIGKEHAAELSKVWGQYVKDLTDGLARAEETALKEVETKLKEEWKADYDKNFELSKRAFKKFSGADLAEFKAHPVLVKAFYEVGKAMGEDNSPPGSPPAGGKPTVGMSYNMPTFK